MLTDEQLIQRIEAELEAGLAVLDPPEDLLARLRGRAARDRRWRWRLRPKPIPGGRRLVRGSGAVMTAVSVAVAIVIAVVALTAFGHRQPPPAAAATVPGRQRLIDMLAVLRRPQTKTDLNPQLLSQLKRTGASLAGMPGTPDIPLIRLARITPWGEKVFLVPLKPLTASAASARARRFEGLSGGRHSTISAHRIDQETLHGSGGAEGVSLPGTGYTRLFYVVPDRVAKVVFVLSHQESRVGPGTSVYKQALTVTSRAHGNVVVIQVNRPCCTGPIASNWYGTNGQVLKRIGRPGS
jgi:hypothetical protein